MTEKTFEEQFPSLKGKGGDNHCSGCECDGSEAPTFSIQELQDNCLDKQKVRDVLNKHKDCPHYDDIANQEGENCAKEIEKELEL